MKLPRKPIPLIVGIILCAALAIFVYRGIFPPSHKHCIKQATIIFLEYANDNKGRFPESDRGWGDALLKLGKLEDRAKWIPYIVGVDDDGTRLVEAMANGTNVDETHCTRIYVQGLRENSNPELALLFDRDSEPGGDHFRCRFKDPIRELITVSGSHKIINNQDWASHIQTQRELLQKEGFTEEQIAQVYGLYK